MATLELTLHHPLPLRWRRHSIVSNQRKGERLPLQRPGVLAIVTFCRKDASQCSRPAGLNNLSSYSRSQRWSRGPKARGQGQGHKKIPRPRTAFPRTDPLEAKDRNARGQGQGPRTQAQLFSKKIFFQAISKKGSSKKIFAYARVT